MDKHFLQHSRRWFPYLAERIQCSQHINRNSEMKPVIRHATGDRGFTIRTNGPGGCMVNRLGQMTSEVYCLRFVMNSDPVNRSRSHVDVSNFWIDHPHQHLVHLYPPTRVNAEACRQRRKFASFSLFDKSVNFSIPRKYLCSSPYGFVSVGLDTCINCVHHGGPNKSIGFQVRLLPHNPLLRIINV